MLAAVDESGMTASITRANRRDRVFSRAVRSVGGI